MHKTPTPKKRPDTVRGLWVDALDGRCINPLDEAPEPGWTGLPIDYLAYGLRIRSSIALPLRAAPSPDEEHSADADVTVRIGATPARLRNPVGKRHRWEAAPGVFLATVDDEARYLVAGGRDIVVEPLGGSERAMGASLVGPPLAALLQQRGLTTLHAGAVEAEVGAVLFPSRIPHEVTVVECDPGDFGAGRFSVNGALRKPRADE